MKAVDTNVLARLVLADDEAQYLAAAALLDEPIWVAATVWLELGWLLDKRVKLGRDTVAEALLALIRNKAVHTTDPDGLRWAVERYRQGADWADLVHLIASRGTADAFVTFDRDVARRCGDMPPLRIDTLA